MHLGIWSLLAHLPPVKARPPWASLLTVCRQIRTLLQLNHHLSKRQKCRRQRNSSMKLRKFGICDATEFLFGAQPFVSLNQKNGVSPNLESVRAVYQPTFQKSYKGKTQPKRHRTWNDEPRAQFYMGFYPLWIKIYIQFSIYKAIYRES